MEILLMAAVAIMRVSAPATSAGMSISSEAIVNQLRNGQAVYLEEVDVVGDLDLRPLVEVKRPLHCRSCHLRGALLAEDVVFDKTLDLSGSQIDGPVEMAGATFEAATTFERSGAFPSRFAQATSFDGATFTDIASFSGALFAADTDFSTAKFRADARFDNADFRGPATFGGTVFDGPATFSSLGPVSAPPEEPVPGPQGPCAASRARGAFGAEAVFSRARTRSVIDFRLRCFAGRASLVEMDLSDSLDMTLAHFFDKAVFDKSRIGGGAFFRAATFGGGASFDSVTASRDLDFSGAVFPDGTSAVFFRLASTGGLLLQEAAFEPGSRMDLDKLSVHRLSIDLGQVEMAGNEVQQDRVLQIIEDGSRTVGDLDIANKARYRHLALDAAQRRPLQRMLDAIFYRTICGYFVRPLQPLAALGILVLGIALVRRDSSAVPRENPGATRAVDGRRHSAKRGPAGTPRPSWLVRYLHRVERTVGIAVSKSPPREEEHSSVSIPGWFEYLTYKLLIVAVLLGVANSNETLRQMLNAVK